MCGATQEQKDLQVKQAAFYDMMTTEYKASFGKQQGILDALTAVYKPILDKGPSQRGFSQEEKDALNSSATETTARNYADAQRSLNQKFAALGGSDFLPSGVEAQMNAGIASTEAADRSSLENQIEQADWATGRANFDKATSALGGVAAELNPNGVASAATNAGEAAGTTANQIAAASNSIWGSVIGGISGIAGAAVGGWAGGGGKGGGGGGTTSSGMGDSAGGTFP